MSLHGGAPAIGVPVQLPSQHDLRRFDGYDLSLPIGGHPSSRRCKGNRGKGNWFNGDLFHRNNATGARKYGWLTRRHGGHGGAYGGLRNGATGAQRGPGKHGGLTRRHGGHGGALGVSATARRLNGECRAHEVLPAGGSGSGGNAHSPQRRNERKGGAKAMQWSPQRREGREERATAIVIGRTQRAQSAQRGY